MVDPGWVRSPGALAVAIICTLISTALSLHNVHRHLENWTDPRSQRYVVRILLIAPVYGICSCIALPLGSNAIVAETIRDIFEALIVYTFLALILEYCGGDLACVDSIKHDPPLRHPCPLCCLPPIRKDGRFLRLCKQGTLQFVVLKPIMGILSLVMLAQGLYFMRAFQVTMLVVYNISYTLALYCLWLFYQATHNLLERHKPILKFVAIKGMVFATYWQGVAVKLSPGISQTDAILWNNFILCVEMVFFSGLLLLAFGVDEYKRKNVHGLGVVSTDLWANFRDVISVRDLVADAYHNFVPAYQDYVLQTNVEDGEEPVRYRARTFLIGNLDADTMMASASKGEGEGEKPSARQPSGPTIEMKNGFGNENEEEEDIEMEFTMPMRTSNFTGPKFRSPLHRTNSLGAQAHQKMVDPEKSKGIMGTLGETLKVPGIPFLKKEESKDAEPDAFDGFGGTEVSDDIDMHLAFTGDSFSVVDDSAFVDEPLSEDRKIEVVL